MFIFFLCSMENCLAFIFHVEMKTKGLGECFRYDIRSSPFLLVIFIYKQTAYCEIFKDGLILFCYSELRWGVVRALWQLLNRWTEWRGCSDGSVCCVPLQFICLSPFIQ